MPHTSETIRAALAAKNFECYIAKDEIIEGWQRKSYWFNNVDPAQIDIHLQLIEDLTEAHNEPKLFIFDHTDPMWLPLRVEDLK